MDVFKNALLESVGARLLSSGYHYNDALRERDLDYRFHKHLGDSIHTFVWFQRQQQREQAIGYGFTVNLVRQKSLDIRSWQNQAYPGSLFARLTEVLWFFYGVRAYQSYDHWWSGQTVDDLSVAFEDVLNRLEMYGLPWLENPRSRVAHPLSAVQWNDFQTALLEITGPELRSLGYELEQDNVRQWQPLRRKAQLYFRKRLWQNLSAFLIFYPAKFAEPNPGEPMGFGPGSSPESLEFDVLLIRKRSADPFDSNWLDCEDCFEAWLSVGSARSQKTETESSDPRAWSYSSRDQLEERLRNALDKLRSYGLPLLENPAVRRLSWFKADL